MAQIVSRKNFLAVAFATTIKESSALQLKQNSQTTLDTDSDHTSSFVSSNSDFSVPTGYEEKSEEENASVEMRTVLPGSASFTLDQLNLEDQVLAEYVYKNSEDKRIRNTKLVGKIIEINPNDVEGTVKIEWVHSKTQKSIVSLNRIKGILKKPLLKQQIPQHVLEHWQEKKEARKLQRDLDNMWNENWEKIKFSDEEDSEEQPDMSIDVFQGSNLNDDSQEEPESWGSYLQDKQTPVETVCSQIEPFLDQLILMTSTLATLPQWIGETQKLLLAFLLMIKCSQQGMILFGQCCGKKSKPMSWSEISDAVGAFILMLVAIFQCFDQVDSQFNEGNQTTQIGSVKIESISFSNKSWIYLGLSGQYLLTVILSTFCSNGEEPEQTEAEVAEQKDNFEEEFNWQEFNVNDQVDYDNLMNQLKAKKHVTVGEHKALLKIADENYEGEDLIAIKEQIKKNLVKTTLCGISQEKVSVFFGLTAVILIIFLKNQIDLGQQQLGFDPQGKGGIAGISTSMFSTQNIALLAAELQLFAFQIFVCYWVCSNTLHQRLHKDGGFALNSKKDVFCQCCGDSNNTTSNTESNNRGSSTVLPTHTTDQVAKQTL